MKQEKKQNAIEKNGYRRFQEDQVERRDKHIGIEFTVARISLDVQRPRHEGYYIRRLWRQRGVARIGC